MSNKGYDMEHQKLVSNIENLLYKCASGGFLDLLKYFKEKFNIDLQAGSNMALTLACEGGHLDIAKYLIENGANINADNGKPLILASENGHLEVVQYLIKSGAPYNEAALEIAKINKHAKVVEYLNTLTRNNKEI